MFEAGAVNWNSVALILLATGVLSFIWFKTSLPKKTKQNIIVIGAAIVILALYSGLMCTACELKPYIMCDGQKLYFDNVCSSSNLACGDISKCEDYLKCKGTYETKVANCQDSGGSSTDEHEDSDKCDDAESDMENWLDKQRDSCTGASFDPSSYYCQGFPNTYIYKDKTGCGYDAEIGCCIGSIVKKSEASTVLLVSGDSNAYRQLLSQPVTLGSQNVVNGSACLTDFYLCSQAVISSSGAVQTMSCDESDTFYCPNRCNFETASCANVSTTPPQSLNPLVFYALIVVGIAFIIFIFAVWRGKRR